MARFALVEGAAAPAEPSPASATAADSTPVPPASTTAKTAVAETPDIDMERASEAAPHSDKKDKDATGIEVCVFGSDSSLQLATIRATLHGAEPGVLTREYDHL
jgi:hypothetical protein